MKPYKLIGPDGQQYLSETPGELGGYHRGSRKIYGRLDCAAALRNLARGYGVKHRVFFKDEPTAIAAGYRPCAVCMRPQYLQWKAAESE